MTRLLLSLSVCLVFMYATSASAAEIIVTPGNPEGWAPINNVNDGTAAITTSYPRSGNGSVEFTLTDGSDKADFELAWNPYDTNNPFGTVTTLGTLSAIGFDWFRDASSDNPDAQVPVLRIRYWNDTDNDQQYDAGEDLGQLIYEEAYNGNNTPEGVWQNENALSGFWWMYNGAVIPDYDETLADWAGSGSENVNADDLSPTTLIYAINTGVGSGWNGEFHGASDNVTAGFSGGFENTYNFEIPEPASVSLLLAGLTLICPRKRKAQ